MAAIGCRPGLKPKNIKHNLFGTTKVVPCYKASKAEFFRSL